LAFKCKRSQLDQIESCDVLPFVLSLHSSWPISYNRLYNTCQCSVWCYAHKLTDITSKIYTNNLISV